ncbi:MAG: S8 family peptidase [Bergeyella sp.]
MKKGVLFLFGFGLPFSVFGQTQELIQEFGMQNQKNQDKYDSVVEQKIAGKNTESIKDEKSRLAGFAGEIPVFLESDDTRANRSANVVALQEGTLDGLSGTPIQGDGMNILVMDGGKVFEKHNEFGAVNGVPAVQRIFYKDASSVAYSDHATNVAGIIGAAGVQNFTAPYGAQAAKGVLTKVNFDSYTFATTTLGTNYQKLAAATTANVSNHSYGVNLGWTYKSTTSTTYPYVGWYWIGNYNLNAQDTYSGSYYTNDRNFDLIVYDNPNHIVVKSSGNYYGLGPTSYVGAYKYTASGYVPFEESDELPPPNCSQGYYCIGWGSLAKNIIVVGATNQLTTTNNLYTQSSDVVKASYSSAGPRRDGAIKPDISAVGSNHLVANYTSGTAYNAYATGSGTSYAAPVVSGIAGAITEVNRNLTGNSSFIYKADEMKAILTHTANEAGNPGPDVWFGWGFADATKAAQLVIDVKAEKATLERNTLTSGTVYSKEVIAKDGESLKASLSWIDPAAAVFTSDSDLQNNHTSRLVNDLDLRIIDTTTNEVYFPWKLNVADPMANATTGDNTVDNIEQVLVSSPVAGRKYKVEVSNKGQLVNNNNVAANQSYALVITGYTTETLAASDADTKAIAVYPTRTKDIVNVLIPHGAKQLTVFDMAGKQVLSVAAKSYQTVDLGNLPKGVYVINIQTDKETVSRKVIKE